MVSVALRLPTAQPPVFVSKPVTAPCVCQFCGTQVYPPPFLAAHLRPERCYLSPMPSFAHQVPCYLCERARTAIYYWPDQLPYGKRHKVLQRTPLDVYVALQHAGATPDTFVRANYSEIGRETGHHYHGVIHACKRLEAAGYVEVRREGRKHWYRVLLAQRPKGE